MSVVGMANETTVWSRDIKWKLTSVLNRRAGNDVRTVAQVANAFTAKIYNRLRFRFAEASTARRKRENMAEMTVTPVATHGFFLDGKWLEEGDIVDVHAPYDGTLIGHVYQGVANMRMPRLPPRLRPLELPGACLRSNANEFCAGFRRVSMIEKRIRAHDRT